ncbi:MAG: hypothetical protein XD75_0195 [Parcubacteria bacterium 33_209]|mgnify:CR=1 FL=1|nr:MAG: hypothetical protein XD75_0195 [Parcubacteria bacterium 33_209]
MTDPLNPKLHKFDITYQRKNIIHCLIDPDELNKNKKETKNIMIY